MGGNREEDGMIVDVTLVATRRPSLLQPTLDSFDRHLLRSVRVRTVFLNIDPIWGTEADDREVEQMVRRIGADVVIRRPDRPGFGAAVKWLWSKPGTPWFLHLEDDWILERPVSVDLLRRRTAESGLAQVSLLRRANGWKKSVYSNKFTTGPSLIRSVFAHRVSDNMLEHLDPEKQLYSGTNPRLEAAIAGCRRRFLGTRFTSSYITDIGRPWREQVGIEKRLVQGESVWSDAKV